MCTHEVLANKAIFVRKGSINTFLWVEDTDQISSKIMIMF